MLGTGLVASSTAGCLSSMPTLGQQVRYADVDVPESDEPTYREWTPASFSRTDGDVPRVDYLAPREVYGDDAFVTGTHDLITGVFASYLDYLGVGYRNYDDLLNLGDAVVGRGSFDATSVRETVLDGGYEEAGEYEGYDLFERQGTARAVAVRDGTMVYSGVERALAVVETVVDARAGRRERLHEADDAFDSISRDLGAMPAMSFWRATDGAGDPLGIELFEGHDPRWSVVCSTADAEYAYEVIHVRLGTAATFSERRLKTHLEDRNEWARAHTADVTVDGAAVDVAVKWTREEALEWVGDRKRPAPPQITWETTVEDGGDAVRIAHLAGDAVDATDLRLVYPGTDVPVEPQFDDRFDTVQAGDELTVDVGDRSDATSLQVVYEPNDAQVLVLEHQHLE